MALFYSDENWNLPETEPVKCFSVIIRFIIYSYFSHHDVMSKCLPWKRLWNYENTEVQVPQNCI